MGVGVAISVFILWGFVFPLVIYLLYKGFIAENPKGSSSVQAGVLAVSGFLFISLVNAALGFFIFQYLKGLEKIMLWGIVVLLFHVSPILFGAIIVTISKGKIVADELKAWRINRFGIGVYSGVFAFLLFFVIVIIIMEN